MSLGKLYTTAAVGVWIGLVPFAASAQVEDTTPAHAQAGILDQSEDTTREDEPLGMFVPIVQDCTATPDVESCGEVRAVIAECAAELTIEMCDVLFEDSEGIFADSDLLAQAQVTLDETAAFIAEIDFDEADGEIGDAIEATRANAERTMLRGDENLNSHSGPPLIDAE